MMHIELKFESMKINPKEWGVNKVAEVKKSFLLPTGSVKRGVFRVGSILSQYVQLVNI